MTSGENPPPSSPEEGGLPESPAEFASLENSDAGRYDALVEQVAVVQAAWAFLVPAVVNGDLQSVWHLVDLPLRAQLAWQWVEDNAEQLREHGHDLRASAIGIVDLPAGKRPLWEHFERVHVRGLREAFPDPEHWGIGATRRPLADELMLIHVVDKAKLADGETWQVGEEQYVYPIVLRKLDAQWVIASLGNSPLTSQGLTVQ
ncbi:MULTISPECIES: hypothetical protein [Gordonia]|uniref:hypothetical protein n=1 Tax=Gordonia sp. 852002-51296_SCH5728562-b TaxID=1834101 RepID=UPI000A8606C9|nr:hypothetical protein [Gordonia sp. 852002-51296_SCH5728562-b]